jgi:hypothetical protein
MVNALGQLLPIALAAAISSVPITVMLLILLSPARRANAVPYLIGWVSGAVALLTLGTLTVRALPPLTFRQPQTIVGIVEMIIGVALVVLGIAAVKRGRSKQGTGLPKWAGATDSLGRASSVAVGVALNFRPKGLLLAIAASLVISASSVWVVETAVLIAVYAALATSSVAAPVILTLTNPDGMERRLIAARDWLARNGSVVSALILIMIGVVVVGNGLTRL